MTTRPSRKSKTPAPSGRPAGAGAARPESTPARAKAPAARVTPKSATPMSAAKAVRAAVPTPARRPSSAPRSRMTREGPGPVAVTPDVERLKDAAAAAATRWSLVTARDLMRHDVVTVAKNTPLSELEKILADRRITGAPVVDETGTMVGVVSMRDLIDRYSEGVDEKPPREPSWFAIPFEHVLEAEASAPLDFPSAAEATVADIMTTDVVSVPANAGIREIARTMTRRKVHRVLVEREGGTRAYVGILGTFEILDMLAE